MSVAASGDRRERFCPRRQSFLEDINPGNTVSGKVVWDVPASGFEATELKLHDSMFSDGVEVSLS